MRPERPSDPPLRRVTLDGGPLAYADEGTGPNVLALHGLPGSSRDFRWLAPAVAPVARFVRPDLPGFGETPEATGPSTTVSARAAVAIELIERLELAPVVVAGHSMGGVVAAAVATMRPDLVRAVVLISSPGFEVHRGFKKTPFRVLKALLDPPSRGRWTLPVIKPLFARAGFRGPYPDSAYRRTVVGAFEMDFAAHAARVRGLTCPTAVAWCADDPLVEGRISRALADGSPPGPRLEFADGGHNPQKHHAVEIADAIASLASAVK